MTPTRRPLPVYYSTLAAEALADEIATAYDIGSDLRCVFLQRGLNDTYLVASEGDRWVARVYRAGWRSPSEIAWELELLEHLAGRGVPVSLPIRAVNGSWTREVPAPEGPRWLVVFTWAPGVRPSWDRLEDARLAGQLAAAIHDAADDFASSQERFCLDVDYLIDDSLRAIEPFMAHRRSDWEELVGLAGELRQRLVAATDGLDWGPCHGDFDAGNMHLDGTTITAFDFDFAASGWRAYDLVSAWRMSSRDPRGSTWLAFQHGYEQLRTLAPCDRAAVPLFDATAELWTGGLRTAKARESGTNRVGDRYLDAVIGSLRTWEAEHQP
jgi:Ser/Thr protein kinase RdoA (MazF antagonist)